MAHRKPRAYLSGGMEYAARQGAGWRRPLGTWLRAELGHTAFDPSRESEKLLRRFCPGENFRSLKVRDPQRYKRILERIVRIDLNEIARKTDYVICYWDRSAMRGAGTKGEISLAFFLRKPVYLMTRQSPERIPSWVLACASSVYRSMPELKQFLLRRYAGKTMP